MKKITLFLLFPTWLLAQTDTPKGFNKQDFNVYLDIAPLFFAAPAFTAGIGAEYDRFQLGILLIRGKTLPNAFKDLVFTGATKVDFDQVKSEEIVFKAYLKKHRKGFYLGGLANFTEYCAIDKIKNESKTIAGLNLDAFVGYRWFPFKKYFYIDPALGFTTNVNKKDNINFANENFTFKSGLGFGSFLFVGARFPIFK